MGWWYSHSCFGVFFDLPWALDISTDNLASSFSLCVFSTPGIGNKIESSGFFSNIFQIESESFLRIDRTPLICKHQYTHTTITYHQSAFSFVGKFAGRVWEYLFLFFFSFLLLLANFPSLFVRLYISLYLFETSFNHVKQCCLGPHAYRVLFLSCFIPFHFLFISHALCMCPSSILMDGPTCTTPSGKKNSQPRTTLLPDPTSNSTFIFA